MGNIKEESVLEFLFVVVILLLMLCVWYIVTLEQRNRKQQDDLNYFIDEYHKMKRRFEVEKATNAVIKESRMIENPQHLRPMFDSQGPLFGPSTPYTILQGNGEEIEYKPTNDIIFYPESYVPLGAGVEEETDGTGESDRSKSVSDSEEATTGTVRSRDVS
jgi:hypothetical protein